MENFLDAIDKINAISFVLAIIISVLVITFLCINLKQDDKKKKILINKNRVNRR